MKFIVTGGPSAELMLANLEEIKTGGRPSFISELRFPDEHQFKIMGEIEDISRNRAEAECYTVRLKHVRAIGDVTEEDKKRTPRRLAINLYYSNIRSGEAEED
ncbi:hypothetical protein IJ095_01700 [Candidatus Saccharibacteria bacterium]|nr:hypothetical protein [Candidatus Saccharibacteria bacterium]